MSAYLLVGNAIDPKTGIARPVPWDYTQLILCRDVYHCTPEELAKQDWDTVQRHLMLVNLEKEARMAHERQRA
jgi:hypothetical protein